MNKSAALSNKFFERLESNFVEYADKVAISYNGDERQITYKELNGISARVHGYLKAKGLKPDDFVMINLPRGAEAGAVAIGVLRAGIAYTIIEEGYPQERIDFIYKDCGCKLCIDSDAYKEILNAETDLGFEKADDHKAAYAIYTSGTTGTPKGVLIERGALGCFIDEIFNKKDAIFSNNDKFACISPLSFVAFEIFMLPILYAGGEFDVVATEIVKDLDVFCRFIGDYSINTAFLPPSLLRLFSVFPISVTKLFTGSEPVRNVFIENVSILNVYAQSETGYITSVFKIDKPYELTPAGKFCEKIKLLDESGKEVKCSELGEICISNLFFRGYINRPEENERAFRGGIYHTGDLGRVLADGSIVLVGRADDMVKINGNRVEPAEIEEVVKNAFGVSWAAAKVVEKNGHSSVCVYYIDKPKADIEEAKKIIASKLPAYMIPANYMQIVKIPLNANGKFSRRLLPEPQENTIDYKKPQTELEQKLFDIIAENINTVAFGIDTNLVSLGLDSISVMKLCKDITEKLGKEISFADVMKKPSVEGIASSLENSRKTEIPSYPVQKYYPLTENQRVTYIKCEIDGINTQYNIPAYYLLENYDADKLVNAIRKVINNHCHLKTRFEIIDGEPMQRRADADEVIIKKHILNTMPDETFFQNLVKPFDLLKDSLYRINVYTYRSLVYLFIDVHHIIFDGMSAHVLINDIIKAYKDIELIPEKINAYDLAIYQKDLEKSEKYKLAEKYFDNICDDVEPVRLSAYSKADGKKFKRITKKFSGLAINDYCRRIGVTVSSFMHAAFGEALHRITREDEFLYITVSNGRSIDNSLQNCTGMFIQTLPVVWKSEATPTPNPQSPIPGSDNALTHAEQRVSDYIHSVHEQLQTTFANECYSYLKFHDRHKVDPEILFIYQGGILSKNANLYGCSIQMTELEMDTPVMPLKIDLYPENNNFVICAEYDGMKYGCCDIQVLLEALSNTAISMTSSEYIKDVSIVSDEKKAGLMSLSEGEMHDYDKTQTWVELFKSQVAANPGHIAVVDANSSMTYAELDAQSDTVAAYLAKIGVKAEEFVAVKMSRCKEFIVVILALHKLGAGYVPVDYDTPEDRIRFMLEDSGARFLLDDAEIKKALNSGLRFSANIATKPDSIAYMIYTSGSTGKPKGVVIQHRAMTNFIHFIRSRWSLNSESRICCHSNFAFDAAVEDLYPVLTVGGTLFIIPEDIRKDMTMIRQFLEDNHITGGCYTTQLGQMLGADYELDVDYICLGGEKMVAVPSTTGHVYNTYGPTEFTVDATYFEIDKNTSYDNIPIGRPLYNCAGYVIDKYGQLVPQGGIGELCLAGPQMAKEYWKRPELTAEKFEVLKSIGRKVYHTGDLVRYNEEGELEYLGRIDFQVKLRGFRIELGEIDNVASQFEGINQVIAQVKKVGASENLVLYYSVSKTVDKGALKSFMAKNLTDYMVPTVFMQLDEMPMTPNGKIDRKALPEPELEAEEIIAPANAEEQKLFEIASEILNTDKFGVTTSLISIGMTSLMSMRFAATVQKQMNVTVSFADIMKHQTIRAIAENLGSENTMATIKTYPKQELYPITENQRGLYIDWEMHKDTTQYNIPIVLKFADKTAEGLEKAIRSAFDAHGYLKTRFVQTAEDVMQKPFEEETEVLVKKLDIEPDLAFFQSRVRPFDLLDDKLYRVEIYSAPKAVYLFMDIHHIIYDGLSSAVLINDILSAYDGKTVEAEKITAYDFALREKEIFASEAFTNAEAHFDALVGDATVVNYPSSTKTDGKTNGTVTATVSADIVDKFCKKNSVTANSFMHAAFAETLHRITREENPLYVTISNGRFDGFALQNTMGMFVKTLPVVLRSDSTPFGKGGQGGFWPADNANHANGANNANSPESALSHAEQKVSDYVRSMHKQLQESYAADFYPYTKIVERHGIHAGIMFAYQGGLFDSVTQSESNAEIIPLKLDTVKFPVTVTVSPNNGKYEISVEYDGIKYSSHEMKIFADALVNAATSMASAEYVKDIRLVSEEQANELLKLSFGGNLEYDKTQTWVDMFKHRVTGHPDSVAVVDNLSSITYKELDKQSDSVAAYLINKGVKPNDFVAIKMGRVKEVVTAIIGINKAGAAYIPIDPDYPEERIRFMLEDSRAKAVLTESAVAEALSQNKNAKPVNNSAIDGFAYMIYTSGTTGKPKGAMILHRGLRAFIAWNNAEFGQCHGTSHLIHASFSFDASVFDMMCPLAAGSTIHILGEELRRDLAGMNDYITANHITGMLVNTSIGMALLSSFEPKLRYMMLGGEKMLPVRKTGVKVYNAYGPTEFTAAATFYPVNHTEKDVPIGRPVPNSYGVVCDKYGHLLPRGIAGELCFAGEQIGAGYWERPEQTEKAFSCIADDVFGGQKVYHTGDLARYNENGDIEYLGRIDTQIKLRGFRIELGEIENRASQHKAITQAVAVVKKEQLCLYYAADGEQIDKDALRAFMAETLTAYMVPTVYMQLEKMPLNTNGKIDRKALPEPEISVSTLEMVKPANKNEAKALEYAKQILPGIEFGVTDNLMELGMSSLATMKYATLMSNISRKIKASDIMHFKNIRALLENKLRICWWHKEYDPTKPNMVFMLGVAPVKSNEKKFDDWSELFNVLVFEPVTDHYDRLFKNADFEEVINLYSIILRKIIPDEAEIFAFIGFSFGGEMAIRMAQEYKKANKKYCNYVILGDTHLCSMDEYNKVYNKMIDSGKITNEILRLAVKTTDALNSNKEKCFYNGPVIYLNAMKKDDAELQHYVIDISEKLEAARKYLKNIEFIDFPEHDHKGMFLDESLYPIYRKIFEEKLAQARKPEA